MRRIRYPLFIMILASLVLGTLWGLKIRSDRAAKLERLARPDVRVRVLAIKNVFSPELLKSFQKQTGIGVDLTVCETPEELWEKLEATNASYDLVTLFSFQLPLAAQLSKVLTLERARIKSFTAVSPDFVSLPGDPSHGRVLPLSWGAMVMGYNSTQVKALASWEEALDDPKLRGKIIFPSSAVEIFRIAAAGLPHAASDVPPADQANLPPSQRSKKAPQTKQAPSLQKLLQRVLSSVELAPDHLSPLALLSPDQNTKAQYALISHAELAYLRDHQGAAAKDWKFVIPEERALFWVLSVTLLRDAKSDAEAYRFLEFLIEKDSALEIIRSFRQASTNRRVEKAEIDARLKPSFLRTIPLRGLDFYQDFSRAREVRSLLSKGGAPEKGKSPELATEPKKLAEAAEPRETPKPAPKPARKNAPKAPVKETAVEDSGDETESEGSTAEAPQPVEAEATAE